MPIAETMLRREVLLRDISQPEIEVVALYAPAGYGKSILSAQLLEAGTGVDCEGVRTPMAFAQRVVQTIAENRPDDSAANLSLAATGSLQRDAGDALGALYRAWKSTDVGGWFVFDNAEHLAQRTALLPILEHLIARRGHRKIVVCSRIPLPIRLTRSASPQQIVTLTAKDLAFTREESNAIACAAGADEAGAEALYAVAEGWPIVTQSLKRNIPTGAGKATIADLIASNRTDLAKYLADEVLTQSDAATLDILTACAVIPNARKVDIDRALGCDGAALLERLGRRSPFLTSNSNGEFAVHPVLATSLTERDADGARVLLRRAADQALSAGEANRAADLYLTAGEPEAAAAAFEAYPALFSVSPPPAMLATISRIPADVLARHPQLWSMVAAYSCYGVEPEAWLRDIRYMWRHIRTGGEPLSKINVAFLLGTVGPFYGFYDDADDALDDVAALVPGGSTIEASLLTRRAALAAQRGHYDRALGLWSEAEGRIANVDMTFSLISYDVLARIARARGDRKAEVRALQDALEAAHRTGIELFNASVLADATFGAWLVGEHERYLIRSSELRRYLDTPLAKGFEHFIDCIDGFAKTARLGYEPPKFRAWAYLIACGECASRDEARWCAERALESAETAGQPFYEALAQVAIAVLDPGSRADHLARARALASEVDSAPFADALSRLSDEIGPAGMLEPLVRRLRQVPDSRSVTLRVFVASGDVALDDRPVDLTLREREIVVMLGIARRPQLGRDLADRLYPESSAADASNALKVAINRVRAKLGKDAIVATRDGYVLASDGYDDVLEIERLSARARGGDDSEDLRSAIARFVERIERRSETLAAAWEWFVPFHRRIAEDLGALRALLIRHDLVAGDQRSAIRNASAYVASDPFDEGARELLIRAYLLAGDQTAAMREYRSYRDTIARELGAEPGEHLLRLIRGEPERRHDMDLRMLSP